MVAECLADGRARTTASRPTSRDRGGHDRTSRNPQASTALHQAVRTLKKIEQAIACFRWHLLNGGQKPRARSRSRPTSRDRCGRDRASRNPQASTALRQAVRTLKENRTIIACFRWHLLNGGRKPRAPSRSRPTSRDRGGRDRASRTRQASTALRQAVKTLKKNRTIIACFRWHLLNGGRNCRARIRAAVRPRATAAATIARRETRRRAQLCARQ